MKTFNPDFEASALAELAGLEDAPPVMISMDPLSAFVLLAQLQLALRHPQNTGRSAQLTREFVERLAERLPGESEVLRKMISAGWDAEFDVPASQESRP